MHKMKRLFLILILLLLLRGTAYADMDVYFLDVGQGDAAIIICDGEAMVIDGGPAKASSFMYSLVRNTLELPYIRYMVATHPHEDHIGGLSGVLNAVPVDLILSPVLEWDTRAFNSILKYADFQGSPILIPEDGDQFSLGDAIVTILLCWPDAWTENDMSIILRIDYMDTSFLFTGDAEYMAEYMVIDGLLPLEANVLKVGHHGSQTSSTLEFINAVNPTYAVISCGRNNSYGHPHKETLESLSNKDVTILRTDLQGTIHFHSNGESITFETERRNQ